jgi:hypothetical protein
VLFLILLLIFLALMVLLWVGSIVLQGFLFTEPTEDLYWRAPAAAAALTVFLGLWTYIVYSAPGRYGTLFLFSPREDKEFTKFQSERLKKTTTFELKKGPQGRHEFRDSETNQRWSRSDAIIVEEDGQKVRFEPDRDEKGNYKTEKARAPAGFGWFLGPGGEQPLQYRDNRGRVMSEESVGRVSVTRWGLIFGNIALNFMHFALWFVCLWLLLRYTWPQSLGLAVVFWLLLTVPLLPMLFGQAEEMATRYKPQVSAARHGLPGGIAAAQRICMMSPS